MTFREAAAELDTLVKPLRVIVNESNARTGWLSLKTPQAIVDRLSGTVEAMGALYESTASFQNAGDVKAKLDSVLRAIKRLKDEVDKAAV